VDLRDKQIVDIGCGGGILSESMASAGAHVTGIDMAQGPLAVARLHLAESGLDVNYVQSTAEDLAQSQPGTFDVVTCLEMLEHVPDPAGVIRSCSELAIPGVQIFFSTINRKPKAFALAILGAEYLLKLLPAGTHEYQKFIRPSELEEWARHAGLDLYASTGMHYNPLLKEYSLGPGLDVNYLQYFKRRDAE
jgi:2-polyprenyl-6-hydroxyphenyl methylase/3-demethylubiquinone-9 3-methyltransferase